MYGRMPGRMLADGEDDGDTHSLAELMPGCVRKIASLAAASVDTVELVQIQSILSNRGAMDMLEGPKQNASIKMGEDQSLVPVVDYPLLSAWYNNQNKENIPSDPNILPRRGFTRREGSGRTTTRRSFKLDLSDIGHPLNSSQSSQIPKDVNAFWEAEDAREASETITQKLKGKDKAREVSNQILQCTNQKRHSLVRRKGTGRRPSRKFDIKLSPYAERSTVQLPKEESEKMPLNSLERIEDREAMENGQTFVVESLNGCDGPNKDREVREDADGALETFCEEPLSRETSECLLIVQNLDGCGQPSNTPNNSGDAENLGGSLDCELTVPENGQSIVEGSETERPKSTPYHKDILSLSSKSTPATSPTPPANPLEALGLMKERRKLDFMQESILNSPSIGERFGSLDVGSNRIKFQLFPSDHVADLPAEADRLESDAMLENAMQSSRLNGIEDREQGNALWEESNDLNGDPASVSPANEHRLQLDSMPTNSVSLDEHNENEGNILVEKTPKKQPHYEQAAVEGEKCVRKLRKSKAAEKSRNSLEGEGTSWNDGVRRSKRIRSRPLEYWRGERFLFGRVHESLLTVIGIKYSSPPVCWPKRGYKGPNFKVDSFVSDDYSDYVKFAAL